jgi:hypothetical protein
MCSIVVHDCQMDSAALQFVAVSYSMTCLHLSPMLSASIGIKTL